MKVLFVSSTTGGGSGRSQRELAARLTSFGHEIDFLVDDKAGHRITRWLYERLADVSARLDGRRGGGAVRAAEQLPGRTTKPLNLDDLPHRVTPVPENALGATMDEFEPDVVVGNSLRRLSWRRIRQTCAEREVPCVLYVREVTSLDHFAFGDATPDALVVNAQSLADRLRSDGYSAHFVPSVIETDVTRADSSRTTALAINPIPSKGLHTVLSIARRCPDIEVVLQESWPLSDEEFSELSGAVADLANVTIRRRRPAGPDLYADARVLLVPYRMDSRPRVIAEAQANGIPVIAADVPALAEAIGDGGVCVGVDDVGAWCEAVERAWADDEWYESASSAASVHAGRPDIDPESVSRAFEAILLDVVNGVA